MTELRMSRIRFSPRERVFLELYFSGFTMKDAARVAGYRGASNQALCNTGRAILNKFTNNPQALFRRAGEREVRIARAIVNTFENSKSEHRQLQALMIIWKCNY